MAAAFPEDSSLQSIFECPVCMESYDDPRVLACAHQFCLGCLEGIVSTNVSLKCPTCSHETKLRPGIQICDLPRPDLVNELQRKIADLLEAAHNRTTRYCDPCGRKKVTAITHCHQCKKNFCESCEANHRKYPMFETHTIETISNCVFCDSHPDDVVTAFCEDCKSCLCVNCIMGDHSDHKKDDIHKLAQGTRRRLGEFVTQSDVTSDKAKVKVVYKQVSEAEKLRQQFHDSVSQLRSLLKEFEEKLDSLERDTAIQICAEIKDMKLYAYELNDLVISKASLLDFAKHLLEKSPEAELVMKERDFPTSPDCAPVVTCYTTTLPVFADTLTTLGAGMRSLIDSCAITYQSYVLDDGREVRPQAGHSKRLLIKDAFPQTTLSSTSHDLSKLSIVPSTDVSPLAGLRKTHSFAVEGDIEGLALDTKRQQLVVRNDGSKFPIRVYDYTGQIIKEVHEQNFGLMDHVFSPSKTLAGYDSKYRSISLDTKRSLYLCPVNSTLLLVNSDGYTTAKVKVGSQPVGVSYSEEEDVYVVSDSDTHKVYVIDATSHKIITKFGGRGSGDGEFCCPYHVHVGRVAGISQPAIVVSDCVNHRVKVHSMLGRHIKTFGSEGEGEGQLQRPQGVTIDPAGRILVCDLNNKRVVTFWQERNIDQWRCLVDSKQLVCCKPCDVSCDSQTQILAVLMLDGHIQMFE